MSWHQSSPVSVVPPSSYGYPVMSPHGSHVGNPVTGLPSHVQLASWSWRAVAALAEMAAYVPGLAIWLLGVNGIPALGFFGTSADVPDPAASAVGSAGWVLLGLAWFFRVVDRGLVQGASGRSWSKRLVGLRLVRHANGQPLGMVPGLGRCLFRSFLMFLLAPGLPLLDVLVPLWSRRRQAFSDMIAGAVVIDERAAPGAYRGGGAGFVVAVAVMSVTMHVGLFVWLVLAG